MMWMMVWMTLFWVVVIGGGLWFLLSSRGEAGSGEALNVLRARLARGEIDTQEFEERKAALRGANTRSRRGPVVAVFVAIALLIAIPTVIMAANGWDIDMWNMHGGGRNTASDPVVRGGSTADVRIEDFAFEPGNLEVPVGATVMWTNQDSAPHDATARNGDWKSDRLSNEESDTLTFTSAGTFDYSCSIHPGMKARLVVR